MRDDRKIIAGCVAMLAECFGRQTTDATFAAYELGLRGLTAEEIQLATQSALERCKFMPTPAELRQMLFGTPDERAERAWSVVRDTIERHRSHTDGFDFGNPAIHAAIRGMGGWEELQWRLRRESEAFARKEFIASFTAHEALGVCSTRFAAPITPKEYPTGTLRLIGTGLKPLATNNLLGGEREKNEQPAIPALAAAGHRLGEGHRFQGT
jgi:hypothetical protein